jgi:[protein-PII] uridylyltransferase
VALTTGDALRTRDALLADPSVRGRRFCRELSEATDAWLAELFAAALADAGAPDRQALALAAVGGYGRAELAPASDLDVVLLYAGRHAPALVSERLWYPVWDAKLKLGHAVRTVKEALRLAGDDLETATSLLTVRHLAGDPALTAALADGARTQWQRRRKPWLDRLGRAVEERHAEHGEVSFLLEPNLKEGRGGLRDVHALAWAAQGDDVLAIGDADALMRAYDVLLDARVELHRVTGRRGDVLALQDQDAVAARLALPDSDALMAGVSAAARTISWVSDEAWHRIRVAEGAFGRWDGRERAVAPGISERLGEVRLDDDADPARDPTLLLRVATAAARTRLRIERASLDRLAEETPAWPDPWPVGASDELVAVLLEGHDAIPALESLDRRDLISRVLPEWEPVRARPQRNAYHRFTVDRHLWETAANAAGLAHRVHRPDLLVLGALLHDLGKGYPGDHSLVGVELVDRIGHRMGLTPEDVEVLVALVRLHLLLPDVATRRDLSDDGTITGVAEAVGTQLVLELLAALTEADSMATGPSAWGSWKAELVEELVDRVAHVLGGGELSEATWSLFPSELVTLIMAERRTAVLADGDRVTTVAPDRPGLFSRVAGVLSIHGLDVLGAQAHSDEQGMAANEFRVAPPRDGVIDWTRVAGDLDRAIAGQLAIEARLAERARTYRRRRALAAGAVGTSVRIDNEASSNATVVEVRAPDRVGLLYRITKAIADLGLDIRHARVQTMGPEVVDSFYVRSAEGKVSDEYHLAELERALLHAGDPASP